MQSISSYINPNTRALTSNYKNTVIKDKEAYNLSLIHIQMCIRDRGNGLSSFPEETGCMGLNDRCDLISSFEKVIQDMNKLGRYDLQMFYM